MFDQTAPMAPGRGSDRQRALPAPTPVPGTPASSPATRPEHFRQASLDDLGAPLVDTTFVVVDLETTGGSPSTDTITEVGAVKLRGGEVLGTFQTLVDPGRAIPPTITVLTGITQAMVAKAPRIETVLPSLLEFMGDAVVGGHNVRFDVGFLQAALGGDLDALQATVDGIVREARRSEREGLDPRTDGVPVIAERVRHWVPLAEDLGREPPTHLVGIADRPPDTFDRLAIPAFEPQRRPAVEVDQLSVVHGSSSRWSPSRSSDRLHIER